MCNPSLVLTLVVLLSRTSILVYHLGNLLLIEIVGRKAPPFTRTSAVHRVLTRVRPFWHKSSSFYHVDLSSVRILNFLPVEIMLLSFFWLGSLFLLIKGSYPGRGLQSIAPSGALANVVLAGATVEALTLLSLAPHSIQSLH